MRGRESTTPHRENADSREETRLSFNASPLPNTRDLETVVKLLYDSRVLAFWKLFALPTAEKEGKLIERFRGVNEKKAMTGRR